MTTYSLPDDSLLALTKSPMTEAPVRDATSYLLLHGCIEGHDDVPGLIQDWGHRVHVGCQIPLLNETRQHAHIDVGQHIHGLIHAVILQLVHGEQQPLAAVDLAEQEDYLRAS